MADNDNGGNGKGPVSPQDPNAAADAPSQQPERPTLPADDPDRVTAASKREGNKQKPQAQAESEKKAADGEGTNSDNSSAASAGVSAGVGESSAGVGDSGGGEDGRGGGETGSGGGKRLSKFRVGVCRLFQCKDWWSVAVFVALVLIVAVLSIVGVFRGIGSYAPFTGRVGLDGEPRQPRKQRLRHLSSAHRIEYSASGGGIKGYFCPKCLSRHRAPWGVNPATRSGRGCPDERPCPVAQEGAVRAGVE